MHLNESVAGSVRRPTLGRCAMAAALLAVVVLCGVARAAETDAPPRPELPPSMLLFGDEHDPDRPVPAVPQPQGRGLVAATLVVAGAAQVLEYDGQAKDLAAIVVDVRVEAGSTTADFTTASVRARGVQAAPPALLGVCVLSKDSAVTVTVAVGTRRGGWTVHLGDREFVCAESSARLAVLMTGGSFRLSADGSGDGGARLLLVFAGSAAGLSALDLPGATLRLEADAAP